MRGGGLGGFERFLLDALGVEGTGSGPVEGGELWGWNESASANLLPLEQYLERCLRFMFLIRN